MTTLGTLSGRGHLFAGDVELGEVEYEIDVLVERGLKHGEGWCAARPAPCSKQ